MGRHHHNFRRNNHYSKTEWLKWIIIGGLLIGAYFYYTSNSLVGFVMVLDYPIPSIAYWVGVMVIGFIIYKFKN